MPAVPLEPKHINFCRELARRRRTSAILNNRPAKNGATTNADEALLIDFQGCLGECAAYLFFKPISWHCYAEKVHDLPDLADFIDVKAVGQEHYNLIVQGDKPDDWAYVLALCHRPPIIYLRGWAWGWEIKRRENWDRLDDRPAYKFPQRRLRSLDSLLAIVRLDDRRVTWPLTA